MPMPGDADYKEGWRLIGEQPKTKSNMLKATDCFKRAANLGHSDAIFQLGVIRLKGCPGIPKNKEKAKSILELAMNKYQHAAAMNTLGYMYAYGDGVDKDKERAMELYKRGMEHGNYEAMSNYGWCLFFWKRKEEHKLTGFGCIKKAAQEGDVSARRSAFHKLGNIFEREDNLIKKDVSTAIYLYKKSADIGHKGSKNRLGKLKNDIQYAQYFKSDENITSSKCTLENAFTYALSNPECLSDKYITKYIKAKNVNSAASVIAGHNLVLLCIRSNVLTSDNIKKIGKSSWYFENNLYSPASKLMVYNGAVIDAIFQHAEEIKVLGNGYQFKMRRELQVNFNHKMMDINFMLSSFADRLVTIEQEVSKMNDQVAICKRDMSNLFENMSIISTDQRKIGDAVVSLSKNLDRMKDFMDRKDRRLMFAGIAKCILSAIPIIGSLIGNAVDAAAGISEYVSAAAFMGELVIDKGTGMDFSNLNLCQKVFSEEELSKVNQQKKEKIYSAVSKSKFKTITGLRLYLEQQTEYVQKERIGYYLLDNSNSLWYETYGSSKSSCSTVDEKGLRVTASKHYQRITVKAPNSQLAHDVAKEEMNALLKKEGVPPLSTEQFAELWTKKSGDRDGFVSEDVFVSIFVETVRSSRAVLINESSQTSSSTVGNRLRVKASSYYRCIIVDAPNNQLAHDIAKEEMNALLKKEGVPPLSTEKFAELWTKKSGDRDEFVSEDVFVSIFEEIVSGSRAIKRNEIQNVSMKIYKEKTNGGLEKLLLNYAVRFTMIVLQKIKDAGHCTDKILSVTRKEVEQKLTEAVSDDGKVSLDLFIETSTSFAEKYIKTS